MPFQLFSLPVHCSFSRPLCLKSFVVETTVSSNGLYGVSCRFQRNFCRSTHPYIPGIPFFFYFSWLYSSRDINFPDKYRRSNHKRTVILWVLSFHLISTEYKDNFDTIETINVSNLTVSNSVGSRSAHYVQCDLDL